MNKFNVFVVLSIVAAASLFTGAMVTPVFAVSHVNGTMGMDNGTMPMDNMTMGMDNSTQMTDNATMTVN